MITTPSFKAHLHVEIISGEGVLLLSEDGTKALHGKVYELIAALLDGRRSADDIVDALAGRTESAKVYYALSLMEKNGYLADSSPQLPKATAAFWHGLGLVPDEAIDAIAAKPVRVRAVGGADAVPMIRALEELGIVVAESDTAVFEVVVADDYLRAGLSDLNAAALQAGRPWLLVRPLGFEPWVGPLYVPDKTGCHQCLARRLARNNIVSQFVAEKQGAAEPPPLALAATPASVEAACRLAALETAKFLAGVPCELQGKVLSLDTRTWATQRHELTRHPACPACGAPIAALAAPVELVPRKVTFAQDGGHRAATPEQTLKKYQHLVSPITGVVKMLTPVHGAEGIAHVYMAGHNSALKMERLDFLKHSLRNASSGKGVSETQAKTSALCEAIERYCGELAGSEIRITASFDELGADDAIHPNAVMHYSDRQYAERETWNARKSKFNIVTEPLDTQTRIDWTPVWSLREKRHKYLPTQLLYFRAPATEDCDKRYSAGCSNGNASGNNLEEAVLQGFFELVERDAVALWWYNRLKKPGVDIASFCEPYLLELGAYYATLGREIWALDITSDLGIPAFVAVSRLREGPQERILFGLGCHLDARIALQRSFAEMNQMLGIAEVREDGKLVIEDDETLSWLTTATVENQPYLLPDATIAPKRREDYPVLHSGDLLEDIRLCQRIVEDCGMEILVLDQTRPEVQMPVVKVIVPGLRHFWARFAPGRLYDVPVQMGWLERPLREDELNPIPIFF